MGNHLDIAPPGAWPADLHRSWHDTGIPQTAYSHDVLAGGAHRKTDAPCNATKEKLTVGGHPVYVRTCNRR